MREAAAVDLFLLELRCAGPGRQIAGRLADLKQLKVLCRT